MASAPNAPQLLFWGDTQRKFQAERMLIHSRKLPQRLMDVFGLPPRAIIFCCQAGRGGAGTVQRG